MPTINPHDLRRAIADVVALQETHDTLSAACVRFRIADSPEKLFPISSYGKAKIVSMLIGDKSEHELIQIGQRLIHEYASAKENPVLSSLPLDKQLSEETRRDLIDELMLMSGGVHQLSGQLELTEFLGRVWPLDEMPSNDYRFSTAGGDIWQHMVNNSDWTDHYLLRNYLDIMGAEDSLFIRFLEQTVHPLVRSEEDQQAYVSVINTHIQRDSFRLEAASQVSGHPVYKVVPIRRGVTGKVKNLIFASTGPKPEIVLADAVNNDIRIVKNGGFCLIYDSPIPERGLRWTDLIEWWKDTHPISEENESATVALYNRLIQSLKSSKPEEMIFRRYYEHICPKWGEAIPALIPQVYLHYDPYTVQQHHARGETGLPRQRMDFLILFSNHERVVIEIDGVQHYADDSKAANPQKYAKMVAADRNLKLAGYEIYRFGGQEFVDESQAMAIIDRFFDDLFRKYKVT